MIDSANSPDSSITCDWMLLLNEQADEWDTPNAINQWFEKLAGRPVHPGPEAVQDFWETLSLIRLVIYDLHFGRTPDWQPINKRLNHVHFYFGDQAGNLPRFRAQCDTQTARVNDAIPSDSDLLISLSATILASFAQDISKELATGAVMSITRCEGLYRDPRITRLSAAPGVPDEEELLWRKEVDVLVEKGLDSSPDILRCADLFVAASRSRFCSSACRTNTFQIIKQLKDPLYLAAKQRRYRAKKH